MAQGEIRRGRRRRPRDGASERPPAEGSGSAELRRGVVKWFNRDKGYGFIRGEDGEEVFVHESAVILGTSDLPLAKDRAVEFEVRQTARGNQAYSVVIVGDAPPEVPGEAARPEPEEDSGPALDFSRRLPASWMRRPSAFVYTYTIYGRRGE